MRTNRRNWNFRKTLYSYFKRIIDFIIAFISLVLLSPIMIVVAIAIKLDSKGPVIFKQERTGKYGKVFKVWKFRTMVQNNNVRDFSKADEHTKVGTFLRKTSLDELPQLFCILSGKMSFLGPRPWITDYFDNMTEEQRHRTDVTPGLSGLAQVNGRNAITIFDKINYDLKYIDNYGLLQDIKLVFLTIKVVLCKVGADAGKGTIHDEIEDLKSQTQDLQNVVHSGNSTSREINIKIESQPNDIGEVSTKAA